MDKRDVTQSKRQVSNSSDQIIKQSPLASRKHYQMLFNTEKILNKYVKFLLIWIWIISCFFKNTDR